MTVVKAYVGTLIPFLAIDLAWIGLILRKVYEQQVPQLLTDTPNAVAALLFYAAYTAGIVYLAVLPAIKAGSASRALVHGAVLGGIAYGTYTVTNYAIFAGWTATLVVSDIAWGTFLTGICALCGYGLARGGA